MYHQNVLHTCSPQVQHNTGLIITFSKWEDIMSGQKSKYQTKTTKCQTHSFIHANFHSLWHWLNIQTCTPHRPISMVFNTSEPGESLLLTVVLALPLLKCFHRGLPPPLLCRWHHSANSSPLLTCHYCSIRVLALFAHTIYPLAARESNYLTTCSRDTWPTQSSKVL